MGDIANLLSGFAGGGGTNPGDSDADQQLLQTITKLGGSSLGPFGQASVGLFTSFISAMNKMQLAAEQKKKGQQLESQANAIVPQQIKNNPYYKELEANAQAGIPGANQERENIKQNEANSAFQGLKTANSGGAILNYLTAVLAGGNQQQQKLFNENAAYIQGQKTNLAQTGLSVQDSYDAIAKSEKEKLNGAAMQYENSAQQWEMQGKEQEVAGAGTFASNILKTAQPFFDAQADHDVSYEKNAFSAAKSNLGGLGSMTNILSLFGGGIFQ